MVAEERTQLKLVLLGPPQVERDGALIDISLRKSMALLAYLAVTRTAHSRGALSALFWPEADETRARGALRYTLSVLNASLGDAWLRSTREQIGLNPDANVVVDVEDVDRLVARVRAHGHRLRQACQQCAPYLEEILTLQRGRLLSGFTLADSPAFDEWHFFESERLEQVQVDALVALIELFQSAGNHAGAIPLALRLLSLDPLNEDVNGMLIRLHAHAGQFTAAIRHFDTFERLLLEELGIEPDASLAAFVGQYRGKTLGNAPLELASRQGGRLLPTPPSALIGRNHELEAIGDLLHNPATRLLTLVGPGGSGKSRLALAIAQSERDQFQRNVCYLPLAGVATPGSFIGALASVLDLAEVDSGNAEALVVDRLRDDNLLLVLDNLEHLLPSDTLAPDPIIDILGAILERAPGVQLLVTSRVRLHLQHEQLYPVQGLDYPEWADTANFAAYGAVQLFVQRARRVQPDFALTAESISGVLEVVRLLAGQPLAIELAAAWVTTLSPGEIAAEVSKSLDLLVSKTRDVPDRQRTMRATYLFSWVRLQPNHQRVLRALSVFRGGFTAKAAAEIAGASPLALQALIDHSLLAREGTSEGETRYWMHELLRQFAGEEMGLEADSRQRWLDEGEAIQTRHARYYLKWVSAEMNAHNGPDLGQMLTAIEVEQDNIQAAWAWAVASGEIEALLSAIDHLCLYYSRRGQTMIGIANCELLISRFEHAVLLAPEALLLGAAHTWHASFGIDQMQVVHAGKHLERALSLLHDFPNEPISGLAAFTMARHQSLRGDLADTHRWVDRSHALAQANGDAANIAHARQMKGRVYWLQGNYAEANREFGESLARFRELKDQTNTIRLLSDLITTTAMSDEAEVTKLSAEAESLARALVDPREAAHAHRSIGRALLNVGHFAAAQERLEHAIELGQKYSRQGMWNDDLAFLGYAHLSQAHYDEVERLMLQLFEAARKRDRLRDAGTAQMLRGLAFLGGGDFKEAHTLLLETLAIYQPIAIADDRSFALLGLSHTWRATGDVMNAKRVAVEALRAAAQSRSVRAASIALAAWVGVLLDEDAVAQAVELESLVFAHPYAAKSPFYRSLVSSPVQARAAGMPYDCHAAAQAKGRKRNPLTVVDELL